mmetsp:Transcript_33705/g.69623  ORF Transcript_33705/g.69623 Transcript_33705/m.69623 type:complete len:84 (-) Transcript_33705:25-276(-)
MGRQEGFEALVFAWAMSRDLSGEGDVRLRLKDGSAWRSVGWCGVRVGQVVGAGVAAAAAAATALAVAVLAAVSAGDGGRGLCW